MPAICRSGWRKCRQSSATCESRDRPAEAWCRTTANGKLEIVSINIEETIFISGDREMLEELVTAAVSASLLKAREAAAAEMSEMAGGLPIPGLADALNRFGGNNV